MPNETTTEEPGVKNLLQWFADLFEAFLEWLAKVLGDSTLRRAALRDLGLTPATGGGVPDEDAIKRQLEGHLPAVQAFATAEAEKVDAVAVAAFIDSIVQVANVIVTIIEASTEDDAVGAAEMVLAFFELFAVRQLRYHQPATFALGQAVTVINERAGFVDWRRLGALIGITPEDGDADDEDEDEGFLAAEQDAFAISQIVGSVVAIGAVALQERFDLGENIEFLYGWDPDVRPEGPTVAERVAARTLTLRVGVGEAKGAVTIALVPGEHGGPGMVVGIGGNLELTEPATAGAAGDALRATLKLTGDAAALYVPFGGDLDATIMGAGEFSAAWVAPARPGAEPYVVGPERGSRLEIGSGGMDVRLSADGFRIQFAMRDSAVVIASGDGDAFIGKAVAARATRLPFDLVLGYDTRTGFFIEGGTGLSTTLPVNLSDPFDLLRVQHVHLALRAPGSGDARALTLEASAAVRLGRGPLQLSLDRIGFEAALDFSGPELDRDSFSIGFKPPSGVGVAFDAEWLKGGGYCYYDPERDEYAGVFEARIVSVTVKVFVIYTRKFPPDAEGREVDENSVFIAGSAQFRVALTGNFFWTGVGVLGGNNRGVAIEVLRKGLTTKALDDVLFPDDPVANAPRILQTLRTVFPLTLDSSVFGVLLELSWGTPTVARLRLGVILQLAEARDRVTLLGQFKVRAPDEKVKAKAIQLNLDFIGDLVWGERGWRLTFDARLSDSKLGEFSITGGAAARYLDRENDTGDSESTWLVAVGGLHPRYKVSELITEHAPLPKLDRFGFKAKKGIARLTFDGYGALTSNSIQIGARVSVTAKKHGFSAEAVLGFDALWVTKPCHHFIADIEARAAIKKGSSTVLGVDLAFNLEGPKPWHARGIVKFKILFVKFTIGFDEEWGQPCDQELPIVDVESTLADELARDSGWGGSLTVFQHELVTLSPPEEEAARVHPLGDLVFRQFAVPLGLELQRFGRGRVAGASRVDITGVTIDGQPAPFHAVRDEFAPGQFLDLTEEEKLARPSFESFRSGVSVSAPGVTAPDGVTRRVEYETIELFPERSERIGILVMSYADVARASLTAAIARTRFLADGPLRDAASREPAVRLRPDLGYVVVDRRDLSRVDAAEPEPFAVASTRAAMAGDGERLVVELHEANR